MTTGTCGLCGVSVTSEETQAHVVCGTICPHDPDRGRWGALSAPCQAVLSCHTFSKDPPCTLALKVPQTPP